MIQFIRKHYILTAFLLIALILYIYYSPNYRQYKFDGTDKHWYQINLAEKFTKTIYYKTKKHITDFKCFVLVFESKTFNQTLGDFGDAFYPGGHNSFTLTDEQFYSSLIMGKPHFLLNIYKEGKLIDRKDIYNNSRIIF